MLVTPGSVFYGLKFFPGAMGANFRTNLYPKSYCDKQKALFSRDHVTIIDFVLYKQTRFDSKEKDCA